MSWIGSSALKQLQALACGNKGCLDLGPHGRRILNELIAAAKQKLWLSVIVLSATLVDVAVNEAGQFKEAHFDDDIGEVGSETKAIFGLSFLSAGERRRLEWLRTRRNRLVHHEGVVEGVSGAGDDDAVLASDAGQAIAAIMPVLENLERWR